MKRCVAVVFFIFFYSINSVLSQAPAVIWQKCLGGNNGDYGWSVEPTTDGGFIVAGYTEGKDNADVMGYHGNVSVGDIWVTKTDNAGNIQWQKCLGGSFFETGATIHQTADGGYIVAGTSASVDCNITGNHGGSDYWLIKLNSKGDISWQKLYGGSHNEYAWSLSLAPGGGYILTGETESNDGDVTVNHGQRDYWVIKTDGSGNLLWQKSLGGTGMDESYGAQATPDGGCIVAGYTESNDGDVSGNHGNRDYWVVKLDNAGNLQWQKALGGSYPDVAWSVQLTNDGNYIVAGTAGSNDGNVSGNHFGLNAGFTDFWVIKLDGTGNILWQKCYGGNYNEIAYYIQPTTDGGYLLAGSAESHDGDLTCNAGGVTDMWIIKIDGTGTLQWQKDIGGQLYDEAHCVKELNDGTYIVVGATCSKDIRGYHIPTNVGTCADVWMVKLSAPQFSAPNPTVTIDPASATVCAGVSATITTSTVYAGLNPTYHWTKNGLPLVGNGPTYTSSGFATNDVIGVSINSGGTACEPASAMATDAVRVKINSSIIQPQITIAADNTFICNCTTVTCKATVTNGGGSPVYQWKVNGTNTGVLTNIFVSNTLIAGDVITCAYSDNASCIAGGSVLSNSIQMQIGISSTPSIKITASADTICTGTTVTFNANPVNAGTNPTYQWKVNGANAGINDPVFTNGSLADNDQVTCTVSTDPLFPCGAGGNAVSNSIVMKIVSKGNPSVNITTPTQAICTGMPATFSASTTYSGTNPSYQWKVNGSNAGINSKDFTSSSLVDGDIVSCTITADPVFTCALTSNATSNNIAMTIKNQAAPSASIAASANDVCAGTMISFTVDAQNAGTAPSYQWIVNSLPIDNSSATLNSNTLVNGDRLYCSVTPGSGACSSIPVPSNIIVLTIEELPAVNIYPADTIINIGQLVQLKAIVSGNVSSFQWTPSDKLDNAFTLTPSTIRLTETTSYRLTVDNDKGCESSAIAVVKVGIPVIMPNAFTPNGDGLNDVFRIAPNVTLQLEEFSIFDRWGNKVFTTKKIDKGWDGIFNGTLAVTGTYVYYIKGSNEKGKVNMKGTVELIR